MYKRKNTNGQHDSGQNYHFHQQRERECVAGLLNSPISLNIESTFQNLYFARPLGFPVRAFKNLLEKMVLIHLGYEPWTLSPISQSGVVVDNLDTKTVGEEDFNAAIIWYSQSCNCR